MATSEASRPRPINTRPLRRSLFRGSNVHQRSPEPDLHPGGEVHRRGIDRHVHVGQVPEDVAGRDVQRAAERDRQVGEVATDPEPTLLTSAAVDWAVLLPYWNVRWLWTWSQIACTRV